MEVESVLRQGLVALISGVLGWLGGWLLSSTRKISPAQLDEFEERVVTPICERLEKVENKLETFCTRGELREAVNRMETASEINRRENRENFRTIFDKLEKRLP